MELILAHSPQAKGRVERMNGPRQDRLDKQMTKFKKSHPEFYAGYRSARVIVDRGGSGGGAPTPPTPPPAA